MGIKNEPIIAPTTAPISAPTEPRQPAPALLAPPIPAKNSISSPKKAKTVIASNVYIEKTLSSACHQAKRPVDITISQLPGRPKTTSNSQTVFSRISIVDQR